MCCKSYISNWQRPEENNNNQKLKMKSIKVTKMLLNAIISTGRRSIYNKYRQKKYKEQLCNLIHLLCYWIPFFAIRHWIPVTSLNFVCQLKLNKFLFKCLFKDSQCHLYYTLYSFSEVWRVPQKYWAAQMKLQKYLMIQIQT